MTIQALAASCAAEPIDVVRIRLTRSTRATVVVSEFRMANRVLADWADQAAQAAPAPERQRDLQVDYEVLFYDGYRLRGCHELTLDELSDHVLSVLAPGAEADDVAEHGAASGHDPAGKSPDGCGLVLE